MRKKLISALGIGTVVVGGALTLGGGDAYGSHTARARLIDRNGTTAGEVRFTVNKAKMQVTARVQLPPSFAGFHGFHMHATGTCDPAAPGGAFTTAGGHLADQGTGHGAHIGDFPPLLVNSDGSASVTFQTDRPTLARMFDADGSAVIVHGDRDNLAHIPTRYAPNGPDAATLATGDAGPRIACGVIR